MRKAEFNLFTLIFGLGFIIIFSTIIESLGNRYLDIKEKALKPCDCQAQLDKKDKELANQLEMQEPVVWQGSELDNVEFGPADFEDTDFHIIISKNSIKSYKEVTNDFLPEGEREFLEIVLTKESEEILGNILETIRQLRVEKFIKDGTYD